MHPGKPPSRRQPAPGLLPGMVLVLAGLQTPVALADSEAPATLDTAKPGVLADANGAGQPPLGRLFFSAVQRQALDQLRRGGTGGEPEMSPTANPGLIDAAASGLGLRDVAVRGVVTSHRGRPSTWLTGPAQALPDGKLSGERVPVLLPDDGKVLILKVGQRYRARDGAIVEGGTTGEAPVPDPRKTADPLTPESDGTAGQAKAPLGAQSPEGDPGDQQR